MIASAKARLRAADGFTLIELLIAMLVGVIVISAAFTILNVSQTASKQVIDRVDATARGRNGMDQVVQQLRSITCPLVAGSNAIVAAGPASIVFNADFDGDDSFDPVQRRLRTVPRGALLDLTGDPNTNGTPPTDDRQIVDGLELVTEPARAVFVYFLAPSGAGTVLVPSPAPDVAAADLPRIARIDVAFATQPTAPTPRQPQAPVAIESSVYPRQDFGGQTRSFPTYGC